MGHWLADVNLADIAPTFTLSRGNSERSHKHPNALILGCYASP